MHDDTPGGLAVKDRALAYWTDPTNFPTPVPDTRKRVPKRNLRSIPARGVTPLGVGFLLGAINGWWAQQ